jgi:hypothetical protein
MIVRAKRESLEKFLERLSFSVDVTDRVKHRFLAFSGEAERVRGGGPRDFETVVHLS